MVRARLLATAALAALLCGTSVVRAETLEEALATAYNNNPALLGERANVRAVDEGVPAHVLTAALYERFSSRGEADFADKLLSAMRYELGGHIEKPA